MTTPIRRGIYLSIVSVAVILFAAAKTYLVDHETGNALLSTTAAVSMLNVLPLMWGSKCADIYKGKGKKPVIFAGIGTFGMWFILLALISFVADRPLNASLLPTALFSALCVSFIVYFTDKRGETPVDPSTLDPRTATVKFDQADHSGLIREVEVKVIPKKASVTSTLPRTKERAERDALIADVTNLIESMFEEKKERFRATKPTAGEADLVLKDIDKDKEEATNRIKKFSNLTLQNLLANFPKEQASLKALEKLLDHTMYADEIAVREMAMFNDVALGEPYYRLRHHFNNLRRCHPTLAREDLSELEGDELEAARKLLRLSLRFEDTESKEKTSLYASRNEFSRDLDSARSKIKSHTPYMTPAMADAVINHPEKVDQVKEMLKQRSLKISEADGLIEEIVNTSTPLSNGTL